jgi:hypothetical protein
MYASRDSKLKLVDRLIYLGAKVDEVDDNNWTVIHFKN